METRGRHIWKVLSFIYKKQKENRATCKKITKTKM